MMKNLITSHKASASIAIVIITLAILFFLGVSLLGVLALLAIFGLAGIIWAGASEDESHISTHPESEVRQA